MWDKTHLKALLCLPRHPLRLIRGDPWRSWIEARGGIAAVHEYLRTCALSADQRALLDVILRHPQASAKFYADSIYVSRRTYFRRLDELLQTLERCLNAWVSPLPARPCINLPVPVTALIGMEKALEDVVTLLLRPDVRLVTLTGPGGVGKTRLAVEVAWKVCDRFADGVCFVPLDAVGDHDLVAAQVARSLGIEAGSDRSLVDLLKASLREQRLLLVLDNFEQLLAAGPLVSDLLSSTYHLKVLITSREVLNLYGEHCFEVPLLPLPERAHQLSLAQLREWPAVRLFVERAQAAYPEFALMEDNATTVVEVCRRLDGLPLAIELAAAHARLFAPTVMLAQLVHPLKFLRGGPQDKPARHRTLWNTIDWSYRLLDETEQVLFRHLSVFANGWETAAAAAVSQVPEVEAGLEALVRKSLIRVVSTDGALGVRFQMLHTVREYAAEQLKAGGESEAARRRHAMYYLALVEEAEPHAKAGRQSAWVARIEQEHDNLRAALSWMLEQGEAELALRLVGSVWRIWQVLNILSEGRRWLEQALHLGQYVRTPDRIKALLGAGWLAICQGSDARAAFEEGLALALDLGARRFLPSLLQGIGNVTKDNNPEFARTQFQESLRIARELGDDEEVGWALDHLGRLELDCGHYAQARVFLEESLAIFRRLQHHWGVTYVLDHLGRVMLAQEQWKEAQALLEEALLGMETFGVRMHVPWTLEALARAILPQGDRQRARNLLARALRLHREAENPLGIALTLSGLAMLAIESADYERAVKLCGAASAMLNVTDPAQLSAVYSYGQWILNSVAAARPHLDEEAFIAAWRGGQAMTPEKAITLAMTTE